MSLKTRMNGKIRGGRGSPIGMRDIDLLRATTTSSVIYITGCCLEYDASRQTTTSFPTINMLSSELDVSIEANVLTGRSLWLGVLLCMGDHRLPKRILSGELENSGQHKPGGKEKRWTDWAAEDHRMFDITGDLLEHYYRGELQV